MPHRYDWVVIGGGIHGTHVGLRLLANKKVEPASLIIVDPEPKLLNNWEKQTAATKMKSLRSPLLHNIAEDPFSLKRFAGKKPKSRKGKFSYPYNRPSIDVFNSHCKFLIKESGLESLHVQEKVKFVNICKDHVDLVTVGGRIFQAKKVVLALGQSEKINIPLWAQVKSSRVMHIFSSDFNWVDIKKHSNIAVVGGGITAIQAALYAESVGAKVHLITRHPLRKHQFDSDPTWLGVNSMRRFAEQKDYCKRRWCITQSRHRGSVPPQLYTTIKFKIRHQSIHHYESPVASLHEDDNGLKIILDQLDPLKVDRLILATGFENIRPGGEMLNHLIDNFKLPVAACGFPIPDERLAWHPKIYVSGSLAELEIGPIAKNIAGARAAAKRILAR
ncbi:MAG: hypothetical protein CMP11_00160 [Zetaproteobacteria bacterium]|nr:hypothetical protein [Pseudobdellovibrionaceae bacterium]